MKRTMHPTCAIPAILLACAAIVSSIQAQTNPLPSPIGAYYSAQRSWMPPLPFHPFPELPAVEVEPKRYVYDDTLVNYELLEAASLMSNPPVPGGGGSGGGTNTPPYIAPTVPIPGVPLLEIEIIEGGVKRVSFDSELGIVYRIEQRTDLSAGAWTELETIVASETRTTFLVAESNMGFYRVIKGTTEIQFPDWHDSIEQFLYFDVYSPVVGTYSLELYADGVWQLSRSLPIPSDGFFGLYDYANYDPAQWPYTGYYDVDEWELRVTVTPAAGVGGGGGAASSATVKKNGLRRPANAYRGITLQQAGIAPPQGQAQDDLDNYMRNYLRANLQVTRQIDFAEQELDHLSDAPVLYGATEWTQLRSIMTEPNPWFDYFHYFGHGMPNSIGSGAAATRIDLPTLQNSRLRTIPLTYAAIDGCRVGEDTAFLKALVSHSKKISRQKARANGFTPRYAASWDRSKAVAFLLQGELLDDHFYFWVDFYSHLTARDANDRMFRTYQEAYEFAREPLGAGVHPTMQVNLTAGGFVQVGCHQCFFDE